MGGADGEETMQGPSGRGEERILVSVRVRPLNEKEASRNEVIDWECISDTTIIHKNHLPVERSMYPTSYTFDRVFRCDCSTKQVYEEGAKAVVLSVVSGINSSVFAYGQTSSGKTYTMSGITEFTMEDIFDYIHKHKEREFQLKFSALEIYNESVRDLLTADNTPLRLLDDPERGTVVEKLTEETIRDWNHFKALIAVCEAQRQIGETFLNEASSRSHQILRLTIESSTREFMGKNNSSTLAATLNFVDLAGSERASQALSAGSRLKEGSHINRSLLTLSSVIRKLSKGRTGHIPYRDSKLTRILQSSLGGNARTAIICTMSPARSYVEQSRNTLLFASCAKEVTTNARVNVVMSDKALLKHLQRELARLETELKTASPSVRPDATVLLREKDLKIEELESRVRELTIQLDHALSQIHDLQEEVADKSPITWEGEVSSYPKLHVRQASEFSISDTTTVTDPSINGGSPAFEIPQSSDRDSRLSYDESYSISDFEENLPPSSPFERMFIETPSDVSPRIPEVFGDQTTDPYIVSEEIREQTSNPSEIEPHQVSEEVGQQTSATFEISLQQVSDCLGAQSPYFVDFDPYQVDIGEQTPEVSKEIGEQNQNTFETDPHQVPEETREQTPDTFEISLQQVSDGHGAKSPYFVEFDPYQVEIGEQTPNSSDQDQYQVSEGITEKTPICDDSYAQQTPETIREQSDDHLEEYCKEVQCIESEMTGSLQANSLPLTEERQLFLSTSHDNHRCTDDESRPENEQSKINPSSLQDTKETYADKQVNDVPEIKNLNCIESRSFHSNNMCSTSLSLPEKLKYEMENENGDDFTVKLEDIQRKLCALKYDADNEVSQTSMGDIGIDEIPVMDIRVSNHMDNTENYVTATETKEITEPQHMDQHPDCQVEDTMQKASESIKIMKDVGLNPQNDLDDTSPWPSDFNRLQREIIDLWDACNVSLVHRTYFFLLFIKDNSADTIYMEVERRRLSFIRDAFSWGNSIVLDGRKLTPGSSKRSLESEREMLRRLMKRRLSSQERKDLYVKWGIDLNAKMRSSQLARCLWIETVDMDHITESARVVAKLVRFSEPQVPKEFFGLNLMTSLKGRRKSNRWKQSPNLI